MLNFVKKEFRGSYLALLERLLHELNEGNDFIRSTMKDY